MDEETPSPQFPQFPTGLPTAHPKQYSILAKAMKMHFKGPKVKMKGPKIRKWKKQHRFY